VSHIVRAKRAPVNAASLALRPGNWSASGRSKFPGGRDIDIERRIRASISAIGPVAARTAEK
jgi:hypothetical protein